MPKDETFENSQLSWSQIGAMVSKYWILVLVVFACGTFGTYLTLQLFFTTQYETKTNLLVKVGRENTEVPATVLNGQLLTQGVRIADINSEVQLLSSRSLVEQVVDEMGPDSFKFELKPPQSIFGYPKYWVKTVARWGKRQYQEFLILANIKKRLNPREKAIVAVSDGVKVEPVKESDVLLLKVWMPDPDLSMKVANCLLKYYFIERAKARRIGASPELFRPELQQERERLASLVQEREHLRGQWKLSSAGEQRSLLLKQLADLNAQHVQNEGEIAQLQQQQATMSAKLASLPEMLPKEKMESRNPALQTIKERLTNLQVERAKLASRYQPDSESMKNIDSEIEQLQSSLDRESVSVAMSTTTELNPAVREFQVGIEKSKVQIAGLQQRQKELSSAAASIQSALNQVDLGGDKYETVEREYRMAESNYLEYAKRTEEARIEEAFDQQRIPNVVVMGTPETPIEPVYPRHLFILAFALPIALLLGIAVAALFESFDDRVRDERSLAQAGDVAFLGSCDIDAELDKIAAASRYGK